MKIRFAVAGTALFFFGIAIGYASQKLDPSLYHGKSKQDAARSLLSQPDPPTAIFASSDQQAIGALHAAVQIGIHVPEQLSIIGFDDVPLAEFVFPSLTTVSQPIKEIAVRAVSLLLSDDAADPHVRMLVDTHLVVRNSCAPPPTAP